MDLAPYLDIDVDRITNNIRQMNPHAVIIPVSAKTGDGLATWFQWLQQQVNTFKKHSSALASNPVG